MNIEKGKPLTLPDGTIILPEPSGSGSKVVSREELQQEKETQEVVAQLEKLLEQPFDNGVVTPVKRTLADVTVDFNHMNVVMLTLSYSIWGLDTFAIARLLKVDDRTIDQIMTTDLFVQTKTELVEALHHAEASTVHGFIQAKAFTAAQTIALSLTSRKEENRLAAAKDILDRGGFRPVDRVEHTMKFEDELRIRYVEDPKIPTLDLTANNDA